MKVNIYKSHRYYLFKKISSWCCRSIHI